MIEAIAPSDAAVTICLKGFCLRSPATNTPGIFVFMSSPAITYPASSKLTLSFIRLFIGSNPTNTKHPATSNSLCSFVILFLTTNFSKTPFPCASSTTLFTINSIFSCS